MGALGLLVVALLAQSPAQDLAVLEEQITTLKAQRATLRSYGDLPAREALDRRLKLLEGALAQSQELLDRHQQACLLRARTIPRAPGTPAVANPCGTSGQGVVGAVVRMWELKEELKTANTWADNARRDALQAELRGLEQFLGLR